MLVADLIEEARTLARQSGSPAFNDAEIIAWLNQGQRSFVQLTDCLWNGRALTTVTIPSGWDIMWPSVNIPLASARYLRAGHRLDFHKADYTAKLTNNRVASVSVVAAAAGVAEYERVTLAAGVGAGAGGLGDLSTYIVYWRSDYGLVDLVDGTKDYYAPYSALKLVRVQVKDSASGAYRRIRMAKREDLDGASDRWAADTPDTTGFEYPIMYSPVGGDATGSGLIRLWPTPQENVTDGLKFEFVRRPLPLQMMSDAPEIDEAFHEALSAYAARMMAMAMKDDAAAQMATGFYGEHVRQAMLFYNVVPPDMTPASGT